MGNQIKTFMWLAFLAGAGCNENVYDAQKSRCLFDEECQAPSVCHPMYHTCTAPAPDANSVDQAVDAEGPDLQAAIDSTTVTSSDADIEPLDRGQDPADTQVPPEPDAILADASLPFDGTLSSSDMALAEDARGRQEMGDANANSTQDMDLAADVMGQSD